MLAVVGVLLLGQVPPVQQEVLGEVEQVGQITELLTLVVVVVVVALNQEQPAAQAALES